LANDAANTNRDNLEALKLLGTVQMEAGDNTAAITTFTRITQKAPQSPGALLELALAQIADKQTDKARHNLQQAIQLKPDFIQAQDTLIRLELADKKVEGALQIARQIQGQQPTSPAGFDREGDIELSQKQYPLAVKAYEQALVKGAKSSGLIKLHHALVLAGESKVADQRLSAWITQNPKDVTVRSYSAEYFMASNHNQDAIAQYEAILKLAPQNILALNNLASLYQRENDNRALAMAEQAYRLAPNNVSIQDTLGWILVDQGQLPRATELLGKAAGAAPNKPTIRYHYGVALIKGGKKAEARKEIEAAIATGQKFADLEQAKALLKSM
jgi:putative PEP-CTERM system TPR-repeat lipoprotein